MPSKTLEKLFLTAASNGEEAKLRACLTLEVNVNVQNAEKETALYIAIWHNHTDIVDILLAQPDIDVNIRCEDTDENPLDLACYNGDAWAVNKLAQVPGLTGVNRQGNRGQTPLITCIDCWEDVEKGRNKYIFEK